MGRPQLIVVSCKRWDKFIKQYPKLDISLEGAIVKDIDDYHYLVDLNILREVLKSNGLSPSFDL